MNSSVGEGLRVARRAARFAAMGVMPSKEVAEAARSATQAAQEVLGDDFAHDFVGVKRTFGAAAMGVMPSQEVCNASSAELDRMIEAVSEGQVQRVRDAFSRLRS